MFLLIRLLRLLLTRRWGWIVLGVVLVVAGVILGASSHQVSYQTINNGSFTPYVVQGGTDYLQVANTSTYYVINEADLSPHFDGKTVFTSKNNIFSIITRSDTEDVDVQLTDGTHLQGSGYQVEQIKQLDSNGQPLQTYSTSEYTQNPNGFYENNWGGGATLIVLGLLSGALAFFVPRFFKNKRQKSFSMAPAAMGTQGQAFPNQQPNPYQQPYQNPSQYPSYPQQPQYQANQPHPPYPPQPQYPSYPPQQGSYEPTQFASPNQTPPQNQSSS
ncbi:MAG: hypothetical protein NVS3B14_09020 [Ktedonobacteraceae bacterium]